MNTCPAITHYESLFASPIYLNQDYRADGIRARRTLMQFHSTRNYSNMVSLEGWRALLKQRTCRGGPIRTPCPPWFTLQKGQLPNEASSLILESIRSITSSNFSS